jgi:HNH endonuclease
MDERWIIVWHPDGDFSSEAINRHVLVVGSVLASTRAEAESKALSKYSKIKKCIFTEFNPKTERFKDAEMIMMQADYKGYDHSGLIGVYRSNWQELREKSLEEHQNKIKRYKKPINIKPFEALEESIQRKIILADCGCWLWSGAQRHGYGTLNVDKKRVQAHRYVYNELVGQIPIDAHLLHSCDNRMCVSPYHLNVGTALDNAKDKTAKNRNYDGYPSEIFFIRNEPVENVFYSIPPDVRKEIKIKYYRKRIPKYKLEEQYNLSRTALNEILTLLSIGEQKAIYNSIRRGHTKVFEVARDKLIEDIYVYEIMMKYLTKRDMVKIRIQHFANGIGLRKLSNIYCLPYEMIKSIIYYNKITVCFGDELSRGKVTWTAP